MPAAEDNLARREHFKDEIVLGVLDVVEKDAAVTQRSVASELGIAVGLANAYLKRCIRKGLIKVGQVPAKRYAYYLTPQGFAEKSRLTATYLSYSFSFFRQARVQCEELCAAATARRQRRLALLGSGDLADIVGLVAREHAVEIAGVVPWGGNPEHFENDITALGAIDAVIVTGLVQSQEIFDLALEVFGANRVHAPPILRLRSPFRNGDLETAP
jgi:DNA-binding MarR family transcriptional regulator